VNKGALIASGVLHAGVVAAGLLAWSDEAEPPKPPPVPVTLLAAGPAGVAPMPEPAPEPAAPELAPEPAPDAVAEPQPEPPPPPPEPSPAPPQPTPPPPRPTVQPAVRPQPPRPTPPQPAKPAPPQPAKPTPPRPQPRPTPPAPEPGLDLDDLSSRLAKASPRNSSNRGAPTTTPKPAGASAAEIRAATGALSDKLQRLWTLSFCKVEGFAEIKPQIRFRLDEGGRLVGRPEVVGGASGNPVERTAEEGAIRAVLRGAPYEELPAELLGQTITVRFDAEQACG
jgi:outer membrane biosynthesis protein TonB